MLDINKSRQLFLQEIALFKNTEIRLESYTLFQYHVSGKN